MDGLAIKAAPKVNLKRYLGKRYVLLGCWRSGRIFPLWLDYSATGCEQNAAQKIREIADENNGLQHLDAVWIERWGFDYITEDYRWVFVREINLRPFRASVSAQRRWHKERLFEVKSYVSPN